MVKTRLQELAKSRAQELSAKEKWRRWGIQSTISWLNIYVYTTKEDGSDAKSDLKNFLINSLNQEFKIGNFLYQKLWTHLDNREKHGLRSTKIVYTLSIVKNAENADYFF